MSSGYPKNFILRHFHNPSRTKIYDNYKSICTIPYSLQSIKIARELKNFGIRTYFSNTPSIGTILRNPITKDNTPRNTLQRNNAVYSIKCNDCDSVYVGETGRYIKDRMQEHDRNIRHNDPKSLIVQHISQTGHTFNTTDPRSHYSNIPHKHKRLVVEALLSLRYNSINRHIDVPEPATETYELIKEAFSDAALSRSRTFESFSRFQKGREKVNDDQHIGRSRSLRYEENKLKIKEFIKSNRRISIKDLSSETELSVGLCHQIVTKDLDMIRTSSKFVPRILTEEQKEVRMDVCKNMVEMTRTDPEWMQKIITGDETWVYQYDPETKRQSSQ
ncbi:hypothetical protein LAZ67_18000513 [Cordylochernes scorpioides]|uniref:GIY-YIG domain-containing protein n=1 Tax=Cordylochernes scorpioides TaxID=51811 RepID=A0ABY6LFA5_9ARAC|nr:hypothetical protein LAZ67_18000513 [Cordylochernes scorpioides]